MTDLELALRELDVDWPATPEIATAVRARIEQPVMRKRTWRMRLAYSAAALALLFGGTMAVSPEARSTVLRWLGLESVEIKREPAGPPPGASLGLGPQSTLAELRAAGVPVLVPEDLGDPPAVYETSLPDGTPAASLVYDEPPVLIQTFKAAVTPFIEKTIGSSGAVERLRVGGGNAYWITGAHGFAYTTPSNTTYEGSRLADSVLLVERGDTLLRVEGHIPRDRAVEIALDSIRD